MSLQPIIIETAIEEYLHANSLHRNILNSVNNLSSNIDKVIQEYNLFSFFHNQ